MNKNSPKQKKNNNKKPFNQPKKGNKIIQTFKQLFN